MSANNKLPDHIDARVAKENFDIKLATLLRLVKTGTFRRVEINTSEIIPRFETESFFRYLKRNTREL